MKMEYGSLIDLLLSGTRTSRDWPVHGCAIFANLPDECKGGASHYEPSWTLTHRGVR